MAKKPATSAPALPSGMQVYIVTENAPPKVAGKSVQPGDELTLTDAQARFEEISGHIRLKAPPAASTASQAS